MKKYLLNNLFFLFLTPILLAQERPYYLDYDWEASPTYAVEEETTEGSIELKNKIVSEFTFFEENFVEYFLEHRVVWLNSDSAIEEYNRVYLPYSSDSKLEVNKARVIQKNGKILTLDANDVYTAQDEETGREYKYFAFEGVEKESIIEYFYVVRKFPAYQGKKISLQSDVEKRDVTFDLFAPEHLVFKFKSYNGIPEVTLDTLTKNKLHWSLSMDKIEKLEEEELAAYDAEKGFIVYKMDQNLYNNTQGISSYGKVAQNIYSFYYPEYSRRTSRELEKFTKKATKGAEKNETAIVRSLEYYIKTTIFKTSGNSEELKDIDEILNQNVASETGLLKLYVACLKLLDIKHEIVLTSDRRHTKFDDTFEASNFLTDFLLYFPKTKQFTSPLEIDSRIGLPPPNLTDNYGLFIKEMTVGELTSGVGKIKYIEPVKAKKTFDEMDVRVRFDTEDPTIVKVNLDRAFNGYYAKFLQPYMHLIKEDDKKEIVEGFVTRLDEDADIVEQKVVNGDSKLFGIKPLQFLLDFKSDAFVEKAGDKYIFKVGELIGQQVQMYQEKQRVLPLENEFQRSYFRTLTIEIPEGYKIANPQDIVIDNAYMNGSEEILSFKSTYEINGNTLTIQADEHYRQNKIHVDIYENYRTVINSAADFNKISLVLEPTG